MWWRLQWKYLWANKRSNEIHFSSSHSTANNIFLLFTSKHLEWCRTSGWCCITSLSHIRFDHIIQDIIKLETGFLCSRFTGNFISFSIVSSNRRRWNDKSENIWSFFNNNLLHHLLLIQHRNRLENCMILTFRTFSYVSIFHYRKTVFFSAFPLLFGIETSIEYEGKNFKSFVSFAYFPSCPIC